MTVERATSPGGGDIGHHRQLPAFPNVFRNGNRGGRPDVLPLKIDQFAGVLRVPSRFGEVLSPPATPALTPNGIPASGVQFDAPSQKSCAERCAVARVRATTVAIQEPDRKVIGQAPVRQA
jgi:hypothetical protein